MSATGTIIRGKAPISERLTQLSLYIVLASLVVVYLGDYVQAWAESIGLPGQGDLLTTLISITIGMILTTILLFFMRRSYAKRRRLENV